MMRNMCNRLLSGYAGRVAAVSTALAFSLLASRADVKQAGPKDDHHDDHHDQAHGHGHSHGHTEPSV